MAIEVKLPGLGDGIEEADVLEVLVKEGDRVEKDQGLVEVETDKATVQVPSSEAGVVKKVHVRSGDSIQIGAPIVTLESDAKAEPNKEETNKEEPKKEAPAKKPAKQQETAKEKKQEPTRQDEDEVEVEKEQKTKAPAKAQPAAEAAPKKRAAERENVKAAAPAKTPSETEDNEDEAEASDDSADQQSDGNQKVIPAGPAVRRFAREVGVDLRRVRGSGPGGRITREDVLEVVRQANQAANGATRGAGTARDQWGPIRVERQTKIRRTIAERMHQSWTSVPRVTNFDDADVTELERIRESSKGDYASRGIKLTALPFVIKAVAMALRAHATINAALDMEQDQVIYKEYVNIGIAVDSERGLVVPVLRNVDDTSISEIARQLATMAEKVRRSDFSVDELRGGTFTISNLGSIGGTYSTPIVNLPEVAILLIGRSRKLPVVMEDQIQSRLMMPLSLSYDHRLVDGAAAARFLNDVIAYLETPSRLLLAP